MVDKSQRGLKVDPTGPGPPHLEHLLLKNADPLAEKENNRVPKPCWEPAHERHLIEIERYLTPRSPSPVLPRRSGI